MRLRQVLGYPAVFLGSSPDRAPSLYHLMSALDLTGGVMYPQGGFTHLIGTIARLATEQGAAGDGLGLGSDVSHEDVLSWADAMGRRSRQVTGEAPRPRGRGAGISCRSR